MKIYNFHIWDFKENLRKIKGNIDNQVFKMSLGNKNFKGYNNSQI